MFRIVTNLGLKDDSGIWQSDIHDVERIVRSYFKNIFSSSNPLHSDAERVLGVVDKRVTTDMNVQLNVQSAVMFSGNVPDCLRDSIMQHLGIHKVLDRDRYLGLPIMIGRSKRVELQLIKYRLWKRLQSWSGRLLSIAGKSVLIQSVAQAIPTYLMSCFRFPKTFVHDLNKLIAKFWWGSTDSKRRIRWKSWDSSCTSKLDGGLGFRDFESFNLALLAKQCWRLSPDGSSLCFRVLKAKYFHQSSFMQATLGSNPSFVWRSLLAGREVIRQGSRWRIGNGHSVDIWRDRLVPKPSTYQSQVQPVTMLGILFANGYMIPLYHGLIEKTSGNVCKLPSTLCIAANRFLVDFDASNRCQAKDRRVVRSVWNPPEDGRIKINTDAAFYQFNSEVVLGAVVRDKTGRVCFLAQQELIELRVFCLQKCMP
ncbi:putative ribonuclease H protein [Corchorus capsularis]|uniref:Putative ribonuclease H protein n=1 Tax=Corchorus capsularis TaxID=210143 RepID=A0A1R3J6N6_COCAP|nr:putative ribonuclease H protein [Corchorus capsularis]